MKLAANLTMMFGEAGGLVERYERAAAAGFRYVECAFPYSVPAEQIAAKKNQVNLQQVLINTPLGTGAGEDKGLACLPDKIQQFRQSLQTAIHYAKILDCKKIHIMAGMQPANASREKAEETFLENLRFASEILAKENICGLIEPINSISIPGYFLNHCDQALKYLAVLPNNIRLQLDVFHLQMTQGCLAHNIRRLLPYTGHIQIAQAPDRHEPTSHGEINYAYVFDLLRSLKYDGFIGLEYIPQGDTEEGLKWIQNLGMENLLQKISNC